MSLTIGRASITTDPGVLDCDGDSLSVAGWFTGSDLNHAKALRQQLLGLANNPDEPVVPFTSTVDTALDGFYRVMSVRVTPVHGVSYHSFKFQYAVDLERVGGGFARPVFEATVISPIRTNSHSVTSTGGLTPGASVWGFPQSLDHDSDGLSDTWTAPHDSADGDITLLYATNPPTTTKFVRFYVAPASYYYAAPTVEVKYGSTWRAVVGRHIPKGVAGNWRLTNGLVRFGPSASTVGRGVVEVWDAGSAAWVTADADIVRGIYSGGAFTEWDMFCAEPTSATATEYSDPVILRNDPAAVTVMVSQAFGGSETYALRRGAFAVDCTHVHHTAVELAIGAEGETTTEITGANIGGSGASRAGLKRSADDANGNRWVVGSTVAGAAVTGYHVVPTTASSWSFCVGAAPNQGGVSLDDAEQVILGHVWGTTASQRIVAR